MSILNKGVTFATGDQVTAAKLNNLVDDVTFGSNIVDGTTLTTSGTGTSATILIRDLGVSTAKIAASAVTTAKIADANVTTAKIADSNVTTAKIADANVTNVKLASDIDASKLTTGTLPIARIADGAVTAAKLANPITRGTAVAFNWNGLTTNTFLDFTSIPSWVKRVTIMLNGLSTNGADEYLIQIGDSGGVETNGYTSEASDRGADSTSTAGFVLTVSNTATNTTYGLVTLCNVSGNIWISSANISITGIVASSAGKKELSDVLDRVRITTTGGGNTFDAGSVNIIYE